MAADDAYQSYLARFDSAAGPVAVGATAKFHGRLVRKLSAAEFAKLDSTYRGIIARGDTINDAVVKLWRERRAELLIDDPEPGAP